MVCLLKDGEVKCETLTGEIIECNPMALWQTNQHCGDCPLLAFAEKYVHTYFEL